MAMWTITYGGTTKTFTDWRISNPVRELINSDVDTFRFIIKVGLFDSDFTFPQDSLLTVSRDGVAIFYGAVKMPQRHGETGSVWHEYTVVGPYWWLKKIVFQQPWTFSGVGLSAAALAALKAEGDYDSATNTVSINISHLILNIGFTKVNGVNTQVKVGTATQITTAVQWGIDHGAPLQLSTSTIPGINVPTSEVRNNLCSEVVERMLSWVPDAMVWFDYSTAPPTLHIVRRSNATVRNINVNDGSTVGRIELKPRYDLQVPSVVLQYEITNVFNSVSYVNLDIRKYPLNASGSEVGALVQNINLEGSVVSFASATIETEVIEINNLDWWREETDVLQRLTWLNDSNITNLKLVDGSWSRSLNATDYPNEIIRGQFCDWMPGRAANDTARAQVSYDVIDPTTGLVVEGNKVENINWPIKVATNLSGGGYQSAPDFETGEPVPDGLEKEIYDSTNPLHYDGTITFRSDEGDCPCAWRPGMIVNILDGRAEWTTMQAIVQSVTDDLTTGQTTISIGAPKHLGVAQIIELLRQTRFRWRQTANSTRGNGVSSTGTTATLGTRFPGGSPTAGKGTIDRQVIGTNIIIDKADIKVGTSSAGGIVVVGDPTTTPGLTPLGGDLKVREMFVCKKLDDGTHEIWRCQVLASDIYKVEGDNPVA